MRFYDRKSGPLCKHASGPGRWIFRDPVTEKLYCFDPPTQLQAIIFVNDRDDIRECMRWYCDDCGTVQRVPDVSNATEHAH